MNHIIVIGEERGTAQILDGIMNNQLDERYATRLRRQLRDLDMPATSGRTYVLQGIPMSDLPIERRTNQDAIDRAMELGCLPPPPEVILLLLEQNSFKEVDARYIVLMHEMIQGQTAYRYCLVKQKGRWRISDCSPYPDEDWSTEKKVIFLFLAPA